MDEIEKDIGFDPEKRTAEPHLTQEQEDLHEAANPPFVEENVETSDAVRDAHGAPLEKVPSAKPSVNNIKSIPNGGLKAWLQVVGSFFVFFNTWGIINTFGIYQTYYESAILASSTPSDISWIGSLQAFMLMLVGTFTGPVYDAGYVRHLLLGGTFMAVLGQMMLSLCKEYWQVLLAQGFCIGIGTGLLFVPGVAILSTYFSTRIATATGLAASGSSLGGVLYPIIFYKLQPRIGFAWASRVIGFIMLATLTVSNFCLRVRILPGGRRRFMDWSAVRDLPWLLYSFGTCLAFLGLYSPFFYVQSYAIENGIMSPNSAFYLLSIINGLSTVGRILPGYCGDIIGPLNMIIPCALMAGVLCLCFIVAHSSASVIIVCAFYGLFSGALVSLPPTIYVRMTKNRAVIGTRIGMGFAVISLGLLLGTPISGAILKAGGFKYVWVFAGSTDVLGTMLIIAARIAQAGPQVMKKV